MKTITRLGLTGIRMKENNLHGLKILVTGHTGFKGAWLTLLLKEMGVEVVGISDKFRESSLYSKIRRKSQVEEYFLDIRDRVNLEKLISEIKVDGIFHLAAQPLVLESYRDPIQTFESNILGTANVLFSSMNLDQTKFIIAITTDKVYENHNNGFPFNESSPLGGHDPYSASKASAELIIKALRNCLPVEQRKKIVSVRAGNVLGGGDDSQERLLPDIIRSVRNSVDVTIRNPHSTRPWQHVLDPLSGYINVASKLFNNEKISSSYNLGPGEDSNMQVVEVCERALLKWGNPVGIVVEESEFKAVGEAKFLSLDSSLAFRDLGWKTKLNANQAIDWTVDWEKGTFENPESEYEATLAQIQNFSRL